MHTCVPRARIHVFGHMTMGTFVHLCIRACLHAWSLSRHGMQIASRTAHKVHTRLHGNSQANPTTHGHMHARSLAHVHELSHAHARAHANRCALHACTRV